MKIEFEMPVESPFNFSLAMEYIKSSPSAITEIVTPSEQYMQLSNYQGKLILVCVKEIGERSASRLGIELHTKGKITQTMIDFAINRVKRSFSLGDRYGEFEKIAARDSIFRPVLERFYGLRPILIPDPFESLVWAILGQQVSTSVARKFKTTLLHLLNCEHSIAGGHFWASPTPEQVATLSEEKLCAARLGHCKSSYVMEAARAVQSNRINWKHIESLSDDEACSALMQIRGIGRWTAEYVLMRGLGRRDIIPAGDLGLQKIILKSYGVTKEKPEIAVRRISDQWTGWRSWAAFYWWMALQSGLDPV